MLPRTSKLLRIKLEMIKENVPMKYITRALILENMYEIRYLCTYVLGTQITVLKLKLQITNNSKRIRTDIPLAVPSPSAT